MPPTRRRYRVCRSRVMLLASFLRRTAPSSREGSSGRTGTAYALSPGAQRRVSDAGGLTRTLGGRCRSQSSGTWTRSVRPSRSAATYDS
eukprot:5539175-Pleurochrysis_carterae.AAC.1